MKKLSSNRTFSLILKSIRNFVYVLNQFKLSLEVKKLGQSGKVLGGVVISGGRNIEIGNNCFIGRNVILDARHGKIIIGDNVEIRDGVRLYAVCITIGSGATLGEGVFLKGKITIKDKAWLSRACDLEGEVLVERAILGPHVSCIGGMDHARDLRTNEILMSSKNANGTGQGETDAVVRIGEGAWIGHGALLLKGVSVSENAVVGAGSVVTKSVAEGLVVAGCPAREIRSNLNIGKNF